MEIEQSIEQSPTNTQFASATMSNTFHPLSPFKSPKAEQLSI